jgi:hypothetical protein
MIFQAGSKTQGLSKYKLVVKYGGGKKTQQIQQSAFVMGREVFFVGFQLQPRTHHANDTSRTRYARCVYVCVYLYKIVWFGQLQPGGTTERSETKTTAVWATSNRSLAKDRRLSAHNAGGHMLLLQAKEEAEPLALRG